MQLAIQTALKKTIVTTGVACERRLAWTHLRGSVIINSYVSEYYLPRRMRNL